MVHVSEPKDFTFRFLVKPNSLVGSTLMQLSIGNDPTEQWSGTPTTQPANTWTDMYQESYEHEKIGKLTWLYFYIKYRIYATPPAGVTLCQRIRGRDREGFWGNISDEYCDNMLGTTLTKITSGYINPRTFGEFQHGLMAIPFDVQVQIRVNIANAGRLEVSSESYVRAVYEEQ